MAQFARPASDVSNIGWTLSTGASAYALIDESSPDDGDYIQKTWNGAANEVEVTLSSVSAPASNSGHIVRYRARMTSTGLFVDPQTLNVSLYDGATLIASGLVDVGPFGTTWTTSSFTLSGAQAGAITSYSNLSLKFETTSGDNGETVQVSWAELEVPNAAAGSGGFTATVDLMTAKSIMFDRPYAHGHGEHQDILTHFADDISMPDGMDDRIWYSKPKLGDRGYKVCAWCGRKVTPSMASNYEGKWYCPDDVPRNYDRGANAWEL